MMRLFALIALAFQQSSAIITSSAPTLAPINYTNYTNIFEVEGQDFDNTTNQTRYLYEIENIFDEDEHELSRILYDNITNATSNIFEIDGVQISDNTTNSTRYLRASIENIFDEDFD